MPQMGYSIGRDVTIVITLADGTQLRPGKVTSFNWKPETTKSKIKALDGTIDTLRFWEGGSGTIKAERRNGDIDAYFASLEAAYYAGISEKPCTIQETIAEPDGSVSQYRFERVILDYDPGTWESDKSVSNGIPFTYGRRVKQA